jgi:uncharacterized protein
MKREESSVKFDAAKNYPQDKFRILKEPMDNFLEDEKSTLTPEEVIISIVRNYEQIANFGVKSIALFGSVARDEARPDSDVDILVDFEVTPTFDSYMELKFYLEKLLGRKVDLADWDTIRLEIRSNVEEDIIPIT